MHRLSRSFCLLAFLLILLAENLAMAEMPAEDWINPHGAAGKLLICGGGKLPQPILARFIDLAGEKEAHLVVIPTATGQIDEATESSIKEFWGSFHVASVTMLHTRSRDEANLDDFVQPLRAATGVWFGGGSQSRIAEAYVGTAVETELYALLTRGGVIGGTSAGAAIQSKLMIASGNPKAVLKTGFDLLPGSVIDQHFRRRNRKPRLMGVLDSNPGHVGFGVDESTALLVDGRDLEVIGENRVTVCLAAGNNREALSHELKQGDSVDLTALRRAARDRAGPVFPTAEVHVPNVPNGALVLGGGGKMPTEVLEKFIDLAGGPDSLIVVLPTAEPDPIPKNNSSEHMLRKAGAKNVISLCQRERDEVESESFLTTLKKARGVWFGGGRQWRFVDAYENTTAYKLFHDVLRRGGVIGGSSAGASIQGEYLCRGSPLGNQEIMAEGYERGFNFLPGVAIDQHFTRRNRASDLKHLVEANPQLIGIGIDESTAIVAKNGSIQILGEHQVHLFRAIDGGAAQKYPNVSLRVGESFHWDID